MIMTLTRQNNLIDPLTRKSFDRNMIYPNNCLDDSVKWFTKINPEVMLLLDKKDVEI